MQALFFVSLQPIPDDSFGLCLKRNSDEWVYRGDVPVVPWCNREFPSLEAEMLCNSCGFKNPDEARFCMKCGAATPLPAPPAAVGAVPAKPVNVAEPAKNNLSAGAAAPAQPARRSFDGDRFVASVAVGVSSLVLALILAGMGLDYMQTQTKACTDAIISGAGQSSCYSNGYWPLFLCAFAVASGGIKMAARIRKK
jgi:hypothetical protein